MLNQLKRTENCKKTKQNKKNTSWAIKTCHFHFGCNFVKDESSKYFTAGKQMKFLTRAM